MFLLDKWLVLGSIVYAVVQFVKPVYDHENHKWNGDAILAIALGVLLAVTTETDLLLLVGVKFVYPYVGQVLSGVLVGGAVGAGLIHDLPDWLKQLAGRPTPPAA